MTKEKIKTSKTNTSALDIAHYLLSLDPNRKYFTKRYGNFRLNSLLHICQILHYAKYGTMLFKEEMIACPPAWYKLSLKQQEKLSAIMANQELKDKRKAIVELYKNIKLTKQERKLLNR